MKIMKYIEFKNLLRHFQAEGLSLRKRFVLYIISVISVFLALLLTLLNWFGILNPTHVQLIHRFDVLLQTYSQNIENDCEKLAAHALSYAEQLETSIQNYLTDNNLTFEELENNTEALTMLQGELYDTVYLNMQIAPASGAFYILNTTVNTNSSQRLYNGLYLKYVNLYSEYTINNDFALYRGSYTTGKDNDITFHSGWQNENKTDFFENCDSVFTKETLYVLSPAVDIPDTWERSRYIYVPIRDLKNNIIGVCGYEMNDVLFRLSHKTEQDYFGHVICALLDEHQGLYTGQFNSASTTNGLQISTKKEFAYFDFGTDICIGKSKEISLGNDTFIVAIMVNEAQFQKFMRQGNMNISIICCIVALFSFICCIFLSKKYVTPILKKIEQFKSNEQHGELLKIREIDDLFSFLEEKDTFYENKLKDLEQAKQMAEAETEKTKLAYEKALEAYEAAKNEIAQLAKDHKKEIVLEDYEFFLCNLRTLTPSEYRIYELYLSGKNAKQIVELLNITENTLKYHNKNIYSKLGISSRKQLLQYATLKQYNENN